SWHAHEWDDREELLAATFGFLSRSEVPALLKEGSVLTLYCFEVLSCRRNAPLLPHVLEHQDWIFSKSPDNRSLDFFPAGRREITVRFVNPLRPSLRNGSHSTWSRPSSTNGTRYNDKKNLFFCFSCLFGSTGG